AAIETSPWGELNKGHPITPVALARLLQPFAVRPGTKRAGAETLKGYERGAFGEVWRRYLPDPPGEGATEPSHRHNPRKSAISAECDPSHAEPGVTDRDTPKSASEAECDGVTARIPLPAEEDTIEYP